MSCTGNCRQPGRDCNCWPEDAYAPPSMFANPRFWLGGLLSVAVWTLLYWALWAMT